LQSVKIYIDTTEQDAIEVDLRNGKVYFTKTAPSSGSAAVSYSYLNTPIEDAKCEIRKAGSSFLTFREYSNEDGSLILAQTVEDQNYDMTIEAAGYASYIVANKSAVDVVKDVCIVMST